jgi:hypothetical protein
MNIDLEEPNAEKKKLELKLAEKKYENTWESCCLKTDKRAVVYFTQMIVICGIMGFSISQLIRINSCEGQQAYMGLLTLLIGLLMPNPKFNK